ncbi:hypothetical protein ABW20_dc0110261 [Dactylellina cionopaga]|nr:hypothetical protein ABW20_dc0110261 [Dactylellina cionopaga]
MVDFVTFVGLANFEISYSPIYGGLQYDLPTSERFRELTIEHMKMYLGNGIPGLERVGGVWPDLSRLPDALKKATMSFDKAGKALGPTLPQGQRKLLLEELISSISETASEQRAELSGSPPTVDEYMIFRASTSAVKTISALVE